MPHTHLLLRTRIIILQYGSCYYNNFQSGRASGSAYTADSYTEQAAKGSAQVRRHCGQVAYQKVYISTYVIYTSNLYGCIHLYYWYVYIFTYEMLPYVLCCTL
jgi:hypothetical protein